MTNKYRKLVICILLDILGNISYILPFVGETSDVLWAPISAYLMTRIFKGDRGKVGAVVAFVEELLPGLDFIPTFTLMWIYTTILGSSTSNNLEKNRKEGI